MNKEKVVEDVLQIQSLLEDISKILPPGFLTTFIVRDPKRKSPDVVITNDTFAAIKELMDTKIQEEQH